jgi:hypothetical protein
MSIVKKEVSLSEIKQMLSEGKTRKEIALELMTNNKLLGSIVFKLMDGKDVSSIIFSSLYDQVKTWEFE